MERSQKAKLARIEAVRKSKQRIWRTSALTFTCGAIVSGALVKLAIDTMPPDEPLDSQRSRSDQQPEQKIANSAPVSAIAAPEKEKIVLPKPRPVQKAALPIEPVRNLQPKRLTTPLTIIEPPSETQFFRRPAIARPPQIQPVVFQQPDRPTQFTDIQGHWAEYFIQTLSNQSVVRGYGDGRFRPDTAIAPSEFARMLRRAFPEVSPSLSFRDLQAFARKTAPTRAEAAMLLHQTRTKSEMVLSVTDLKIQGEVTRPGRYSLAGLSEQNPKLSKLPTVARAIEYAGGLQASADLSHVQIHRTTETGQKHVITVNLQNPRHDLVLEQGDEIVIPASTAIATTRD